MSEPTPSPLSDDEARRQRLEALRALSHSQSDAPAAISGSASGEPARQPRRAWRQAPAVTARRQPRWLVVLSGVVALVLVAGIVLHQMGIFPGTAAISHKGPSPIRITAVLALSLEGPDCVQDAAWSPNGQQVAVLGYRDLCPSDDPTNYNYQAGVLQIYTAATGKLVRTILPDATVLALPGMPAPPANAQPASPGADTSKLVINYTNVLWSPDGKQLALTFTVTGLSMGLVLMNATGTNEHAALFSEANQPYYSALRWDTSTLSALELPTPPNPDTTISLPPAQSYSWSADGQLVPSGSLSAPSSPTTPIGNPDGGKAFTIWQPGFIGLYTQGLAGTPLTPGVYMWNTAMPVWSPDGHYLIDSFNLFGIVHPVGEPRPTAAGLSEMGVESAPSVAIRDPALQQLLPSLNAIAELGASLSKADVAWSPNGRVLAAIPDDPSPLSAAFSPPVTLYDCATGKTIATLQLQSSSAVSGPGGAANPNLGSASLLRWSADGSQLFVYSDQLDSITVWRVSMLT